MKTDCPDLEQIQINALDLEAKARHYGNMGAMFKKRGDEENYLIYREHAWDTYIKATDVHSFLLDQMIKRGEIK